MPPPDVANPVKVEVHVRLVDRQEHPVVDLVRGNRTDFMTTKEYFTREEFVQTRAGIQELQKTAAGKTALTKLETGEALADAEKSLLDKHLPMFKAGQNSASQAVKSVRTWTGSFGNEKVPEHLMRLNSRPVFPADIHQVAGDLAKMERETPGAIDNLRKIAAGDGAEISKQTLGKLESAGLITTRNGQAEVEIVAKMLLQKEGASYLEKAGVKTGVKAAAAAGAKGVASVEFLGGVVALAVGPLVDYFTEQKEKAAIAPGLLKSAFGKERGAEAYQEYKTIMSGQLIASADPTQMSQVLPQVFFERWANKYNLSNDLREKLMPESMLFRAHTPEERTFAAFYDRLPARFSADMPAWMQPYVAIKQKIVQETFNSNVQKFTDGLVLTPIQQVTHIGQSNGIDGLRDQFMTQYTKDMEPFKENPENSPVTAWLKNTQPNTAGAKIDAWLEGAPDTKSEIKITAKSETPSVPAGTPRKGNFAAMKQQQASAQTPSGRPVPVEPMATVQKTGPVIPARSTQKSLYSLN